MEDLVGLRKQRRMSQAELGSKLRDSLITRGITLKHTYAEKKISMFESGVAQPSISELEALAEILKVDQKELSAAFSKAPVGGPDFFRRITNPNGPWTLIAALYGGRLRITGDDDFNQAILEALQTNVFMAMYCPYPDPRLLDVNSSEESLMQLSHYYSSTRLYALNRYKTLKDQLPHELKHRLILLEPNIKPGLSISVFMPPFDQRRTLMIQSLENGTFQPSMYTWIETAGTEAFYRVGTFSTVDFDEQHHAWEAYFGAPIKVWKKHTGFAWNMDEDPTSSWKSWGDSD